MIEPALTPEEWASRGRVYGGNHVWMERTGYARLGIAPETICVLVDGGIVPLRKEDQHMIAALCLHNRPFGFTHSDVEFLREVARDLSGLGGPNASAAASELADRIAALLPREDR